MLFGKKLAINTLIMTGASLLMNCISMAFQSWLVKRIGTAGIGLYQLVLSVTGLMMTFAISGIRFASTRLVSEELGLGRSTVDEAMGSCFSYALFFGSAAAAVLYFAAEPIGILWLGDVRTVSSLRLSAISMPCSALCGAMSGYFTAVGRISKQTVVHIIELLAGAAFSLIFLNLQKAGGLEECCFGITLGRVTADVLSLLLISAAFLMDRRRYSRENASGENLRPRLIKTALPLAFSAYARSALSTVQHILVPRGLRLSGLSRNMALSGYGIIQGMVLPIIFFPSCILSAAAELIVPVLTQAQMKCDLEKIESGVDLLFYLSLAFSVTVCILLFIFSDALAQGIYKCTEAGRYIRLLAPLVPVMYTDMTVDGCLKGLGQQLWSMRINIIDSALSVLLVWLLLPKYVLSAYIWIIYFTEILNFLLSYLVLSRTLSRSRRSCSAASSHPDGEVQEKCACKAERLTATPPLP